ncbi:MAG: hypothetical protein JWR16_1573 [Nevskia sp.]|nr:hypothetical protein [Nevskia sp.]
MTELLLTLAEARVLACLVEKSIATPQYYPMTVNAIMLAANQKNSRNPITHFNEGEVGAALTRLEQEHLVARDDHAGRVPKWRQRMQNQLLLKPASVAVLATLMLRGPQTAAELRTHAQGLGGPGDAEELAAAIADLEDRAQPLLLLLLLPRAPGQSAARYAQLLCGAAQAQSAAARIEASASSSETPARSSIAELEARVQALEARLAEIEQRLTQS